MTRRNYPELDFAAVGTGTALAVFLFFIGPPERWIGRPAVGAQATEAQFYALLVGWIAAALISRLLCRWTLTRFIVIVVWTALACLFAVALMARLFWMVNS